MMAPILGMLVSASGISLPAAIITPMDMLAPSAAPVALFALGMSLSGLEVRRAGFDLAWLSLVKLIIHPLATWGLALLLNLDPVLDRQRGALVFITPPARWSMCWLSNITPG